MQPALLPGPDHIIVPGAAGIARLPSRINSVSFDRVTHLYHHSPGRSVVIVESINSAFTTSHKKPRGPESVLSEKLRHMSALHLTPFPFFSGGDVGLTYRNQGTAKTKSETRRD